MFGKLFAILSFCEAVLLQMIDTHVDVQIHKINESHITGICSCSSPPYGKSVEFLIDNKTVASISLINEVCYTKRRPCETNECYCTSTQFNITMKTPDEMTIFALTCQVRVQQGNLKKHVKVFTTKTFNGKDIIGENTYIEHIRFANGDLTQLSTNSMTGSNSSDNTLIYVIVCTLIPVTAIIITALLWRYIKKSTRSIERTETEQVSNEGVESGILSLLSTNAQSTQEGMPVMQCLKREQESITEELDDEERLSNASSVETLKLLKGKSSDTLETKIGTEDESTKNECLSTNCDESDNDFPPD